MRKFLTQIIFLLVFFVVSFAVWYSPVVFKGYAPYKVSELIPLAKNINNTGQFSLESDKNVYLASALIEENGNISTVGNKFTARLYAYVFKFTGILGPESLTFFSIIINSLSLAVFAFIVMRLYGVKFTVLFSLVYIFLPFNWLSVYSFGTYEFAVFFMSFFSLFFVLGRKKKREFVWFVFAGIFLALAGLSKETFFLLAPIIPAYLWFSEKNRKAAIGFAVSVILMLSVFYIPSFFIKNNGNFYLNLFFADESKEKKLSDYTFYGHLYPDPYIYLYEKEVFLADYIEQTKKAGFMESLERKKVLANMGERSISIIDRFLLGLTLVFGHTAKFFSLEDIGGPFVIFFSVLGFFYFKRKEDWLGEFSIYWVGGVLFLLSFAALVSRHHLKDFVWLIPLFATSGVFVAAKAVEENFNFSGWKNRAMLGFISFAFLYGLALADHVTLGNLYDKNRALKAETYASFIKKENVADEEVIALGLDSKDAILLNYLTDRSVVILTPDTVKKLSSQGNLENVLDSFDVKYILGYEEELSAKITKYADVKNIATSSVKIKENRLSPARSFILNLVK